MPADPNSIDYRSQGDAAGSGAGEVRRTAGTWAIILLVWAVGLASWVVWLGAVAWIVVRALAP